MRCVNCQMELSFSQHRQASISILVMGDEVIYSYFRCDCGSYSVECFHDRFMGEHDISSFPISDDEGLRAVQLVTTCPDPDNKFCECLAHKSLCHGRP